MTASILTRYANPARFGRLADRALPVAAELTAVLFAVGLFMALVTSPPDYQQGETVRIMYVHVPAAWLAMVVYLNMAIAALIGYVWRHLMADLFVRATAPIGAAFTLMTGSLWGAPMWGTWWAWDARLTSVLLLFFLYLGYLALVDAFDDPERGERAGSLLVLVGVVNIPIIRFSVDWWATLHQPTSVARLDGPSIHPDILVPLMVMALAFTGLYVTLALVRLKAELAARRLYRRQIALSAG